MQAQFAKRQGAALLALGLFLLLGGVHTGAAQPSARPSVRLGLKAGGNYSMLRRTFDSTDRAPGLTAGVFGRVTLGSTLSLQPEVLYVQKGGQIETQVAEDGALVDVTYSFDYLEVPVLLQVPLPIRRVQPRLYGGPYFGVALSKDISIDPDNGAVAPLPPGNYEDVDYGFALGAELDVPAGTHVVTADFRWTRGIYDLDPSVFENNIGFREAERSAHNGTFALTVGVLF